MVRGSRRRGEGGVGGGSRHKFPNNNFVSFMSHKTNGVFDLGHMFGCSPGTVVGGSKRTEV